MRETDDFDPSEPPAFGQVWEYGHTNPASRYMLIALNPNSILGGWWAIYLNPKGGASITLMSGIYDGKQPMISGYTRLA